MRVSSTQNTGSADAASTGLSLAQTGNADGSFASLLGVDDGARDEAPPAKDRTGTKQNEPGRKDVKDRGRKSGSSSSLPQTASTTNMQVNQASLNIPLLAGSIAVALNGNAEIPAGTTSIVSKNGITTSDSLDGVPRVPTRAAAPEAALGSNGKAVPGLVANPANAAMEADKSGGVFALPAKEESSDPATNSSKPMTTTSDKSVADPNTDAAKGTAQDNGAEVSPLVTGATQSLAQTATDIVFQSLQDVPQGTPIKSVNSPKGGGAVEAVQAGTVAGRIASSGIETSAKSIVATSTRMATTQQTSVEQLAGSDSQIAGAPPVAATGGNQPAGGGGEAHGDASGGGSDSSGSGDAAHQTPASKNVVTAADLTQVARGQATAAPAPREGAASSANSNISGTHSATQPMSEAGVARVLQSAMRGDVRVGVQTEAFGRVTIQTIAGDGQLSAQLSLENVKQSAALALHLPAVEQKLTQQYGINASVNLAGASSRGAGGMMSDGRGSNPNNNYQQTSGNSAGVRGERFNPFSLTVPSIAPAISSVSPRYRGSSLSQRLDVTV